MKLLHQLLLLPILLSSVVTAAAKGNNDDNNTPDYLIVGAGGAGLQMALYMEKFGFSYKILEKTDLIGSHFSKFPRYEELISLNKAVRNETQKLRFDWHTLLEAPVEMLNVTRDFFPKGKDWHRYMNILAQEAGIYPHIEFGVEVERVADDNRPCVVIASTGEEKCAKHRIFVGTGLQEKKNNFFEALGAIPYSKSTTSMAEGKRVCILGNGNSGFELAQNVYKVADRVFLYGRHGPRLSSVTRYTGDVRVKYLQVLENLNMKMLDTVDFFIPGLVRIKGLENILSDEQMKLVENISLVASWLHSYSCEIFFTATGFDSAIPGGLTMGERFPMSGDWYQAVDNNKVHYIGWLMHGRDFRKSAGGFLSGFRYLIRNLAYHIREEDAGIRYPHFVMTKEEVVAKTVARAQVADDIFILQDGHAIRDVIVPNSDGTYSYYEGICLDFHPELKARKDIISYYFEWGTDRNTAFAFEGLVRYEDTNRLLNVYLHPAFEVGGMVRQVQEDVELEWLGMYADAVESVARKALDGNMEGFVLVENNPWKPAAVNQTKGSYYETVSPKVPVPNKVMQTLWKAVYTDQADREMGHFREAIEEWFPTIVEPQTKIAEAVVDVMQKGSQPNHVTMQ
ncbi:FAD-dependent oxidoreductase domain-containing protein 2 [Seminavis robusta]|uniref:FAD-dependent oxidoreductase domain-containing protein 2 n=1 Tax=Seminavis robusta TaxID=568900 RepID=A0A9N8EM90_9STRA|nr:FAD-dependent oxidoreductase domain-containing protein 2 [Seminavis robusta]|eukprot:Sro1398_g269270.1 FAD-dependent oxidoreductase domain-containing protein 2 (624) ;mRNA; r:16670-18672